MTMQARAPKPDQILGQEGLAPDLVNKGVDVG